MPAKISDNAMRVLTERYLEANPDGKRETPDDMFRRVSGGNPGYRKLMEDLLFLPNSPTLFNMGTKSGGTLSACFVFDISDSLNGDWPPGGLTDPDPNSIIGTLFKASCVAKAGGGVGYYFGNLRPKGSPVRSVHRKACGPVEVVRFMHRLRSLITQGGKRDLAQMGVLNCDHADIMEFVHMKDDDPKALESFNISVSWKDSWLKKVDFGGKESVPFPVSGVGNPETQLWVEQCMAAWRTGCPGMLFDDLINFNDPTPHLGRINATNPCGETPNRNDEPCNLGSMTLWRMVVKTLLAPGVLKGGFKLDWDMLRQVTREAARFLDDILDWNTFPHPNITKAALATRKLGLGVMGWADLLALLHVHYDTDEAVTLAGEVMQTINREALEESIKMAERKGVYPGWNSHPDNTPTTYNPHPKARNSTRTSIAPTGTIAILADASSSIEPHYALEWDRTTHEGIKLREKIVVADRLNGFVPKTANGVHWSWHVKMQAAFQKFTDLGVSKTINMPNAATVKDISDAYRLMWESGCKGGTVYRDGCRPEQVLRAVGLKNVKASVYLETEAGVPEAALTIKYDVTPTAPARRKLPEEREGKTHKFNVGGTKGYLTHNRFGDGKLGEIFVQFNKPGGTMQGLVSAWAVCFSNALQWGTPLEDLVRLFSNVRFEPAGLTGSKAVPVCTSVVDYIVRHLAKTYLSETALTKGGIEVSLTPVIGEVRIGSGQLCPKCGTDMIYESGCLTCPDKANCGYTRCG